MRLDLANTEPTLFLLGVAGWATVEGWAHLAESDVTPATRWTECAVLLVLPAAIALWAGPLHAPYSQGVNAALAIGMPWLLAMACLGRRFLLVATAGDGRLVRAMPRIGGSLFGWAGVLLTFLASFAATVSLWLGAWQALPLLVSLMFGGMGVATEFGQVTLTRDALLVGHGGLLAVIRRGLIRRHEWVRDERGAALKLLVSGRRRPLVIRCAEEWAEDPDVRDWFN